MYKMRSVQAGLRLFYTLGITRLNMCFKNAYLMSYPSRSFGTPRAKRYVLYNTKKSKHRCYSTTDKEITYGMCVMGCSMKPEKALLLRIAAPSWSYDNRVRMLSIPDTCENSSFLMSPSGNSNR